MQAHIPTLFLAIVASNIMLALALAVAASHRHFDGLKVWSAALALHAVAYALYGLRGQISDLLSVVLANVLIALALAMFARGIFQFQKRPLLPLWFWLPAVLIGISFPFLLDQLTTRIVLANLIFAAQCLLILYALARHHRHTAGRGQYLILGTLLFLTATFLFRALGSALGMVSIATFTTTNSLQVFTFISVLGSSILLGLGLLAMTKERAEAELQESLGFLEKISGSVPGVIFEFRQRPDGSAHFPYISPRVEIFQLRPADLATDAAPLFARIHPDDLPATVHSINQSARQLTPWRAQFRMQQITGGYHWYEGQSTPQTLADGTIAWYGYFSDIKAQKDTEDRMRQMALHDPLTGLPNRVLFDDRVQQALIAAERDNNAPQSGTSPTRFGLMFIDLDHFKPINDHHGHRLGDLLLQAVANRIRIAVRESDTPARIGGDEFVILLRTLHQPADASRVGEKIRTLLSQSFIIEGHTLAISASIGIAFYPDHGTDTVELARHADEAMYQAKQSGRNTLVIYQPPPPPPEP